MTDLIISGNLPGKAGVEVSWSWKDQASGTVEWTFKNTSSVERNVLLFRSGYYFGNAFWPVYLSNPGFNVDWSQNLPLTDKGAGSNSAPIAVVDFAGKKLVCFVFTLLPAQSWSMLEGGFSGAHPTGISAITVSFNGITDFCVEYDPAQVQQWDQQTGTKLSGYSPNPKSFKTAWYSCSAKFYALYNDVINSSPCP